MGYRNPSIPEDRCDVPYGRGPAGDAQSWCRSLEGWHQKVLVAEVKRQPIYGTLKTIVVDKKRRVRCSATTARATSSSPIPRRSAVASFPRHRAPTRSKAPIYYYDPDKNFVQGDNNEKLRLPPGPNNPVGSVYIALTKPTYGLHGTPDPSKIDKNASHGCVRMTNWDASELAHLVKRGIVVTFKS
jgi:lipoprotein-anchoring transpeptidase ErfK/SrfK